MVRDSRLSGDEISRNSRYTYFEPKSRIVKLRAVEAGITLSEGMKRNAYV